MQGNNIDVRLQSRESYCYITGIAKVGYDRIAVVDSYNNRVKIINVHSNKIISFVDVEEPFDITCVNDTELAVSCGGALQSLELNDDNVIIARQRVEFETKCFGIDYTKVGGELFTVSVQVKDSTGVRIINREGQTNHMIRKNEQKSHYVMFSNDGKRIYVTTNSLNRILCLSTLDGSVLHFFDHASLKWPSGIAVDKADNVYVVGERSNTIHIFAPDLSRWAICLDISNGIDNPTAITYCEQEHALYVCCRAPCTKVVHKHLLNNFKTP